MWLARYSAAASILSNRSRLVPGAGSPDRYRGATCSSQARLYKAPTASLTLGSWTTRKRHRCIFPPLGAQTPASRIFLISSFGTGSGLSRRIERVVLIISNSSVLWFSFGMAFSRLAQPRLSDRAGWCKDRLRRTHLPACPTSVGNRKISGKTFGCRKIIAAETTDEGGSSDGTIRTENLHVVCRQNGGSGEALSGDRIPGAPEGRTGQEARRVFPERYRHDQSTCTPLEIR